MTSQQKLPELFLSLPHECSYLPNREASTLFIDPNSQASPEYYPHLIRKGFRRSGRLIYRPHCRTCNECISVRIPVNEFEPRRGQRRVWARNQDLRVIETRPCLSEEHFSLYRQYQQGRHTGGSMDHDDHQAYEDFLVNSPVASRFMEVRSADNELLAVAVTDIVDDGYSAVYTFYDPEQHRRGLGVYAILQQIRQVQQAGLDYLYLGYWIAGCDKMSYKQDYRPLQGFRNGTWQSIGA